MDTVDPAPMSDPIPLDAPTPDPSAVPTSPPPSMPVTTDPKSLPDDDDDEDRSAGRGGPDLEAAAAAQSGKGGKRSQMGPVSGASPLLFGLGFVLLAALVVSLAMLGLSARCKLSGTCTTGDNTDTRAFDKSSDRYNFDTFRYPMPFPHILAALSAALFAGLVILMYAADVVSKDTGTARMREIAAFIAEGAVAFLRTEYLFLSGLVLALFVLLGFAQNWQTAGCYLIGAVLSGLTGYIGMSIATLGNVRTTAAAADSLSGGLNVAFRAGAVMGLAVVSVGLAGLSFCYLVFRDVRALAGFAAGASTVALFARVGGGIYTKAADVGADLVGKVEANIPEDDPRNPATIADNVGDNVGDVAGMGADLFESYVGSIIATAVLGSSLPYLYNRPDALCVYNHLPAENALLRNGCQGAAGFAARICRNNPDIVATYPRLESMASNSAFVALPFLLALGGVLIAVVCTLKVYVSPKASKETDKAKLMEMLLNSLRLNIYVAGAAVIALAAGLCFGLFGSSSEFGESGLNLVSARMPAVSTGVCPGKTPQGEFLTTLMQNVPYQPLDSLRVAYPAPGEVSWRLFLCILIGLVLGNIIGALTEYFTAGSFSPTRDIAQAGEYGAGAVVIQGLGVGLLSTGAPLVLVAIATVGAYELFGSYGIALAAVGMLSTLGVTMATDAYGPVADNAGGIAEMAELDPSVRDTTDALDALGNTTAATGKGFSNGSAVLTAYALLTALVQDSGLAPSPVNLVKSTGISGTGTEVTLRSYDQISLVDPFVVFAILIGVCLPFIFGAFTMLAVSRAAQAMIVEVRRQFREITGLREGADGVRPDHVKCIDISTRSSIAEMVLPGALAIMAPLIVGFGFGQKALVALLLAAIVSGYMMGILMSNAGGAWDNAKKLVESGFFGEGNAKGSEWHKATVAGDTVGDPFKDTSGPSMNILIKMMTTFGLVTVSLMQPDRNRGWIGAILLVGTAIAMIVYYFLLAKFNARTRAEANRIAPDANVGKLDAEQESEPLVA